MLIPLRRVRNGHLDLVGQVKEPLAPAKHPIDLLLRHAMVDQVGEPDIATGRVEAETDLTGVLGAAFRLGPGS